MKKLLFIASLTMLFLTAGAFAQKGKPNPSPTPTPTPAPSTKLSVKFEYCGTAADVAACEAANKVRNDSDLPYVDGSSGVSAVFYIGGSNDFVLRLDRSTRTLRLDFSDAAYQGGTPTWWYTSPQQDVRPQMNVLGAYNAKLQCGGAPTCNVNFETRFNMGLWKAAGDSKSTYAVLWNPTARADRPVNSPLSTSAVNVNYIKDVTGERYIITPLPSASCTPGTACELKPFIAGLEKTSGNSVTGAGQYHMPFRMVITVQ
jgi:hypothetical protein